MKLINWNSEKNELLKETRNISFEEIVIAINEDKIIDTVLNPNQLKYPNQKMYLISINDYIHVVPFVENGNVFKNNNSKQKTNQKIYKR